MKKIIQLCMLITLLITFSGRYSAAEHWEQVATNGFGDSDNDYAWSMKAFKGKLYVGTLNVLRGGEIWCSPTGKSGSWQKVYDARSASTAGIRNLYNDKDQFLYACTVDNNGAEILRTADGQKWITVKRGSENRENTAFRGITQFGEYFYVGGGETKAQLYRSKDGLNWSRVKTSQSFDSTRVTDADSGITVTNNIMIGELVVFQDQLYAFTWTKDLRYRTVLERAFGYDVNTSTLIPVSPGAFEVWRSSDGLDWEKVVGKDDAYGNGMGFCLKDPEGLANEAVTSAIVFKGNLYLGTVNDHARSSVWRTADGTQWTKVVDFFDMGEEANYYAWRMISFQDKLFVGTMNLGPETATGVTGAQIWVSFSGDPGTFYPMVHNGFDGKTWSDGAGITIPKNCGVRTFGIFNDTLFAGTATILSVPIPKEKVDGSKGRSMIAGNDIGCEIWKLVQ